ncbi:nucleotide-diphospho-sugar transferase [Chloropicon primus]|uniref:Nucleotide-diphospho-sugar transferase n=1 Tax=Chloropicon primus TaxID=1764295 RepID=A0A5B8MC65_9CHLO|nr:nucleotide-diphospho-sugar transferase [Chloropicon primus]|eukprot:QDZ18088.1 nucleotide-diphospho-sugar transferase [Chloropicon primus]
MLLGWGGAAAVVGGAAAAVSGLRLRSTRVSSRACRVSVVVPVVNEEACISSCLASLGALDPPPLEVIVVDGGSRDGTAGRVRKARARRVALIETDFGSRAKQMNEGARVAKGDFVMFLHADTVPPLDAVSLVDRSFADPRVVLGAFTAILAHEGRTMWGMNLLHQAKTHLGACFFRPMAAARGMKVFFGDQAMVVRREAFVSCGGFHESLSTMEDMDLCVKMFYGIKSLEAGRTSLQQSRGKQSRGARLVAIDRCVHTSGRRVAEWGSLKSLQLFLVLSLSYAFGASPSALNELAGKVYSEIR